MREIVRGLRIGRRQQVEHGRSEVDQVFFGRVAFFRRIGVEFADQFRTLVFNAASLPAGSAGQRGKLIEEKGC